MTNQSVNALSTVEFSLDVSDAVPTGEKCVVSGTLFVPEEIGPRPTVVVAVPGASYNRRYWDIRPPSGTDYSQARYFAQRGIVFAAMDYLGGGDSSRPADVEALTLPVVAGAAHQAVVDLREGLHTGSLLPQAVEHFRLIGLGHSFGGAVTIVQQATFGDFDAIAVLGYSALESGAVQELPGNWDELSVEERRAIVNKGLAERFGGNFPAYHGLPREGAWRNMYPDGTTDDLIAFDDEVLHTTVPRTAGVDVMTPRFTLPYASTITVPVFLAFGEHDTCTQPYLQPSAYASCPDLTLTTYSGMKHLHNFAESRTALWERSVAWLDYINSNCYG